MKSLNTMWSYMHYIPFFLLGLLLTISLEACSEKMDNNAAELEGKKQEQKSLTIAFGSCSHQDAPAPLPIYTDILNQKPDVWIWLGDIIYADTEDMDAMKAMYKAAKNQPQYKQLRSRAMIFGTWDDHDYGVNDGWKAYPQKSGSKANLFDFLDVPDSAVERQHEGVYSSHTVEKNGFSAQIILLDTRWFRDELEPSEDTNQRYKPSLNGDILGEEQWAWLENELVQVQQQQQEDGTPHIVILGSSIQLVSAKHPFEKWENFPSARRRMLDLLASMELTNLVVLSGDRHHAEASQITVSNSEYSLLELTASGMTHSSGYYEEPNEYRISPYIGDKNYGILRLTKSLEDSSEDLLRDHIHISAEIRGEKDTVFWYGDLPRPMNKHNR